MFEGWREAGLVGAGTVLAGAIKAVFISREILGHPWAWRKVESGSTKDAHHESEFSPDLTFYSSFLNKVQGTSEHNGEPMALRTAT